MLLKNMVYPEIPFRRRLKTKQGIFLYWDNHRIKEKKWCTGYERVDHVVFKYWERNWK